MKPGFLIPAAATGLLHAALIGTFIAGFAVDRKPDTELLKVELLVSAQPPKAAGPSDSQQAASSPERPEKKRAGPTPPPRLKPTIHPQAATIAPIQAAETSSVTKDSPLSPQAAQPATPAPVTISPSTAAAAISTPPARTSASEASYASTNRTPPYPRISLSNGDEGTVVLRVLVTAEGTAGAVEVKASSGYPLLDESARQTVQTWRFKPATLDGKPVAEWYQIPIPFKLQNN